MIVIQEKVCSKCKKVLPATNEFFAFSREIKRYGLESSCKICFGKYAKEHYKNNRQSVLEYQKNYAKIPKNKKRIKKYKREYERKRLSENIFHKCSSLIRNLIKISVRNKKGGQKTEKILGCTFDHFIEYIESLWKDGMSWENHGGPFSGKWQLHHLMPLHTAEEEEELILLNHYTNFYPLWTEEHQETHRHLTRCGL